MRIDERCVTSSLNGFVSSFISHNSLKKDMKNIPLLIIALMFFGSVTIHAQSSKIKNTDLPKAENSTAPTSTLKDIRSIPSAPRTIIDNPLKNFKSHSNLVKSTGNERFMKIKKDDATGLPIWISGKMENAASLRSASREVKCLQYLDAVKSPLQIENPEEEFFVKKINTDDLGQTHIRMQQQFQGVPVYGAEIILHEKDGDVIRLNGRNFPTPNDFDINPTIQLQNVKSTAKINLESFTSFKNLSQEEMQYVAGEQFQSTLVIYHPEKNIQNPRLAYHLTVIPNLIERWEYIIDAKTGEVLSKHSSICKFHAHLENHAAHEDHETAPVFPIKKYEPSTVSKLENLVDGPATANEVDLLGVTRTINTYEVNGTYFMYDGSRS